MNLYSVHGLTVRSELSLPELILSSVDSGECVTIEEGPVAPIQGPEVRDGLTCGGMPQDIVLSVKGIARFRIRGGDSVIFERAPNDGEGPVSDRDIRVYLLGSVLGTILHQRGLFALHASSVEMDGLAWLFSAPSGFGKSTIAAELCKQPGVKIVADDVTVVRRHEASFVVSPGIPRFKLWKQSLEHLAIDATRLNRVFSLDEKYEWSGGAVVSSASIPLGGIFLLGYDNSIALAAIDRASGLAGLAAVLDSLYNHDFMERVLQKDKVLEIASKLVDEQKVFGYLRPHGLHATTDSTRWLIESLRTRKKDL